MRSRGARSRYEAERFNPKYKGSPANRDRCVVYHQLLIDLRKAQYNEFLYKEMLVHIFTVSVLIVYAGIQLDLDQISDATSLQRQIFLESSFPRISSPEFIEFAEIVDKQDVAQYIFNVIYAKLLDPKYAEESYTTLQGAITLLWGVRFRVIQVEPSSGCVWRGPLEFRPSAPCVAGFSRSRQNVESHGCYSFQSPQETGERTLETKFASYPPEGWVVDVNLAEDPDDTTIFDTLQSMFAGMASAGNASASDAGANDFVNDESALLLVSCTLYSPNTNVIMYAQLGFEFLPSGLVHPVDDLLAAPFVKNAESNLAVFVVGGILAFIFLGRLVFQVLNAINLGRLVGMSFQRYAWIALVELVLAASLVLILTEVLLRLVVRDLQTGIVDAISDGSFSALAGAYVERFSRLRNFSAFAILLSSLYVVKYFRLFWGFRFIYVVMTTSAADLGAFYATVLALVLSFSSFIWLLYGPYSLVYATFKSAFEACLLQVTGYFTMKNLHYASPIEALSVSSFFIVLFIICFNLVLLNLYVVIVLKAFGIVYSEVLEQQQGNDEERPRARLGRGATQDGGDDLPGCRRGEVSRPFRTNATAGTNVFDSFRDWMWRNQLLVRNYKADKIGCFTLFRSCFCCVNHLHSGWLSTREVIERLQTWRSKTSSHAKNFLTFVELRRVLEGEARERRQIDNFQVDQLFAICAINPTLERAKVFQETIAELEPTEHGIFDYIRGIHRATKQRELLATQRSDLLEDFMATYEALMDVKLQQLRAEMRLSTRVRGVQEVQEQIRGALSELHDTAQELAERTDEAITT